jgi:hypothetical protein
MGNASAFPGKAGKKAGKAGKTNLVSFGRRDVNQRGNW